MAPFCSWEKKQKLKKQKKSFRSTRWRILFLFSQNSYVTFLVRMDLSLSLSLSLVYFGWNLFFIAFYIFGSGLDSLFPFSRVLAFCTGFSIWNFCFTHTERKRKREKKKRKTFHPAMVGQCSYIMKMRQDMFGLRNKSSETETERSAPPLRCA